MQHNAKQQFLLFTLLFCISLTSYADSDDEEKWQQLKTTFFGDKIIREKASDLLFIEVPNQIEDAAFLPITVKLIGAQTAQHYIKTLHLLADNNPDPNIAHFSLSPDANILSLSTRIRMESFSYVRAIAEMQDGTLHMVSRFVIASGGCSAPASRSNTTDSKHAIGQIRIRHRPPSDNTVDVQILIRHPNYNGFQIDPKSQQLIPPHFINNIEVLHDDAPLIKAATSITLSENPSIRIAFSPKNINAHFQVHATDNQGNAFQARK